MSTELKPDRNIGRSLVRHDGVAGEISERGGATTSSAGSTAPKR